MMNSSKIALLVLFFGGLFGLAWTEYKQIPTGGFNRIAAGRVLPELLRVNPTDVRRVEIDGKDARIVLERRSAGRWDIVKPIQTRANALRIEALVQTLRQLPKSADTGTLDSRGSAADFGLDPPEQVIRLFGADPKQPLATLAVGKLFQDNRYVRGSKNAGVDLVDSRILGPVEVKPADWRQRALFPTSPIDVETVAIAEGDRKIRATRQGGRWEISEPSRMPGDEPKFEGLTANLVSLEVTDAEAGFVENQAKNLATYGLEPPEFTIELSTKAQPSSAQPKSTAPPAAVPQRLLIGKEVPGDSDKRYACLADTRDVVIIRSQFLKDLKFDVKSWRSNRLANFDLAQVTRIAVKVQGLDHQLARGPEGWRVVKPAPGKADEPTVGRLLNALAQAKAIELRSPEEFPNNGLADPKVVIQLWEGAGASVEPSFSLKIGALDRIRSVVYSQVGADRSILSLDPKMLEALPLGALAFRDRTILSLKDAILEYITIQRPGKTVKLVAGKNPTDVKAWRMSEPAKGPIDEESLARLAVMLMNLRAEDLVTDAPGDLKAYGLDPPAMTVSWTMRRASPNRRDDPKAKETRLLFLGGPSQKGRGSRFARVSDGSTVFTVVPEATQLLESEFRKHRIFDDLRIEKVTGMTLRWPDRAVRFIRSARAFSGPDDWKPETGADATGIDLAKLNELMGMIANLATTRYAQYDGIMPADYGLTSPKLVIDVSFGPGQPPRVLRIGNPGPGGQYYATVDLDRSGPVFLLPREFWAYWVNGAKPAPEMPEMPENVFAP
jgi:Domain of unknown function (DUF4340)